MKETSEPLVQQYRELAAVVRNFIQLKLENRVRCYEVEPILQEISEHVGKETI